MISFRRVCLHLLLCAIPVFAQAPAAQPPKPQPPKNNPFEAIPVGPQTEAPKPEAPKPAAPGTQAAPTPLAFEDVIEGIEFRGVRRVPQDTQIGRAHV